MLLDIRTAWLDEREFQHVLVTDDNMEACASWSKGICKRRDLHRVVEVPRRNGNGVMFAWPGSYILMYKDTGEFEVRSPRNINL